MMVERVLVRVPMAKSDIMIFVLLFLMNRCHKMISQMMTT